MSEKYFEQKAPLVSNPPPYTAQHQPLPENTAFPSGMLLYRLPHQW